LTRGTSIHVHGSTVESSTTETKAVVARGRQRQQKPGRDDEEADNAHLPVTTKSASCLVTEVVTCHMGRERVVFWTTSARTKVCRGELWLLLPQEARWDTAVDKNVFTPTCMSRLSDVMAKKQKASRYRRRLSTYLRGALLTVSPKGVVRSAI